MKPTFTPVTGGNGNPQQRGRQPRPQISMPQMPMPGNAAATAAGQTQTPTQGPPPPSVASPAATSNNSEFPPIRPRSASLSRESIPIQPGQSQTSRPSSIVSVDSVEQNSNSTTTNLLHSPTLTLSRDNSTFAEPVHAQAVATEEPIVIDVPPPRAPSPDVGTTPLPGTGRASTSAIVPQPISFTGSSSSTGAPVVPAHVPTNINPNAPIPSYKQPVPAAAPTPGGAPIPRDRSLSPSSTSLSVPGTGFSATRPRGGRKSSNPNSSSIVLIPPAHDPPNSQPRYAILDYSAEAGTGQYQIGSSSLSLEAYLQDATSKGIGVGKGGGGKVGEGQQTARWVHCSYSASSDPRNEWGPVVKAIRQLGSFRGAGNKKNIGGRTFQKQTLTIDESGVGFSIPVYAEDLSSEDPQVIGIQRSPSSKKWNESFGSTYTYVRPESTVLEALSRVEGRTLKRGRMEFRIEFIRGWRVDDIRMLLLTTVSLRDPELENDLFNDPKRGIMPTANVHTDGTALLGSVLRSVIEIMAEVVTFMEDAFADAEGVVFMKPAVIYQQVLTALKAEMLVVKRDLSVVENQVRALAGFLVGVAPQGSAWAGSVINVEAVANECVVLRDRLDALLQRCDALVGLVNFEVTAYQNRTIFALTAVSMLFLPAGIYSEAIKMDPEYVIGDGSFFAWATGLAALFFVTNLILFVWVSPTVIRDSLEEMVEWDRDALTRSRRIFFKRLKILIEERKRYESAAQGKPGAVVDTEDEEGGDGPSLD